ncbi:restriction endonuclease subunit R [Candidatus Woesearchaeota archaeon CG10_big_fil_rev_8_21_14_0_10_32_9]|nr:MAG: restriction endonuclease subunit R [Candidatus Woesearchaeota archaeon CG10_big_fil_rev_8_21_14_0_10_32_9]
MNESQTEFELIEPKLRESGWGVVEGSKIFKQFPINLGRIQPGNLRASPLKADYVLSYKGRKLAVIEAKSDEREPTEGVAQAKDYALKLHLATTYATNGKQIYEMCMETGKEWFIDRFPTPQELWNKTFQIKNDWKETFNEIPRGGIYEPRFYQEIATNKVLDAIAEDKNRILLTLATGTGKTTIAFQIAWKLFQSRWTLQKDAKRRPRILFLADRNILANQAFNEFSAFPEDALVRIKPDEIRKKGKVPTNGSIFFTIFQTFMSGPNDSPYFGEYPKDYFDFIIIDECHRGGANDEGNWRAIMEYFSPAVQLGLTATPKRKDNADTYKYFGEPVYTYSLKEGINDGFLTPFKIRRIKTTMDDYIYTSDDEIIEGEVEAGKIYEEADFNRIIEIKEREAKRVNIFMNEINQNEKAIVFCATQDHALAVRDLINQVKKSKDPNYCVRVTANDGKLGEQYLEEFRDNEKTIPTILTTSQKLSTGVDARNIRSIILMRPVNSMIEFKQIVGRGTRLFDGKEFFTIYDFVDAYKHFNDPEWDGEPLEPEQKEPRPTIIKEPTETYGEESEEDKPKKKKLKIKLSDGKEREIQHMIQTSFWNSDGKPISAEEFLHNLYGKIPEFFKDEDELRKIWSDPITRKALLDKLAEAGYGMNELKTLQQLINAENSDIFDVLEYIAYEIKPISREERVAKAQNNIFKPLDNTQKEFLEFVLSKYIEIGIEELDQEKLPALLKIKYQAINDATEILGGVDKIRQTFINFQKHLFAEHVEA